jgi:NADH-quinone oxidoreductase subunit H
MDQIFVLLQHWLMGMLPAALQPIAGILLGVAAIVCLFPALFALTTVFERKGLARIQNRIGPNRVGPLGILQPVADGIKSLTKEDIVPLSADAAVHFLAPLVLVVAVFMGFAVLPMGRNMVLVDMDAGLLFFFAMGASTELAVFMAGWSSRNKYSLLGAMRAVAQMISYEVPLLMSSVAVVMIAGSLSLTKIVEAQNHYTWGLPHWYIFTPWPDSSCTPSPPRPRPTAPPSTCPRASRNWWRATTPNIRASSLRSSFWASTWPCFPSPVWAPRSSWADGRRPFRFWAGCRRGSGSSPR